MFRQRSVARHVVEKGRDDVRTGVAVDQRGAERRVRMGPAGEQRKADSIAPPLDPARKQPDQAARLGPVTVSETDAQDSFS